MEIEEEIRLQTLRIQSLNDQYSAELERCVTTGEYAAAQSRCTEADETEPGIRISREMVRLTPLMSRLMDQWEAAMRQLIALLRMQNKAVASTD